MTGFERRNQPREGRSDRLRDAGIEARRTYHGPAQFEIFGGDEAAETRLEWPTAGESGTPPYLAPLLRILEQDPPREFTEWLEARIAEGAEPVATGNERLKTRPWSAEAVREHDTVYRLRLRTLHQLGLRSIGTVLSTMPSEQQEGYGALFQAGPGVEARGDGTQLVDLRTDAASVDPFRGEGRDRQDSGHRIRPDKQASKGRRGRRPAEGA